jgi:hypothetical protein
MTNLVGDSAINTVPAVLGTNTSPVRGDGVFGDSTTGRGVVGRSNSDAAEGVGGFNIQTAAPAGPGVLGVSAMGFGMHGHSTSQAGVVGDSDQGDGVFGNALNTAGGVTGKGSGVVGHTNSAVAEGVGGFNFKTDAPSGPGVLGVSVMGIGVHGHSTSQAGVVGDSDQGEGVHGETNSTAFAAVAGLELNLNSPVAAVFGQHKGSGPGVFGTSQGGEGVHGETNSATFAAVTGINLDPGGQNLAGFFQGNVTVQGNVNVKGDIFLPGADCAEHFDTVEADQIEAGTVVVIDRRGALRPSREAYDKKVAGVVSGGGSYRPAIVLDKQPSQNGRVPVALVGKVCCKVDARYSPVDVGDLLTTSPTAGHAMKVDDPSRAFGAVIGKALQALTEGQALIPILIALQ